jgi:aminoglycoside 3-N-acetyltransferase
LLHLGRLADCKAKDMPLKIIDILLEVVGKDGTLAVLAPFYDYADKKEPFDTRRSPVSFEVGVLNAALAERKEAERSANPLFSLAALGRQADYICNGPNASAFGAESAWDRIVGAGAKVLLLGSSIDRLTLVRYIEQRVAVPYLYIKLFKTPIYRNQKLLPYPVTTLLRYRDLPLTYNILEFGRRLRESDIIAEASLGGGRILAMDAAQAVDQGIAALQEDIHFFLEQPPTYVDNAHPLS